MRTFAGQAVGGDAWQRLPADVAEGRPGVGAGVPVVHPGEMLHVELAGLRREKTRKGQDDDVSAPSLTGLHLQAEIRKCSVKASGKKERRRIGP